jgi:integral membrane protein
VSLKSPLDRYRLLAYIVGVGLVTLVFVGVPLKYWAHSPGVAKVVGTAHGFLYIVYLVTVLELGLRYRLKPLRMLALASAGFVPFVSFIAERSTTAYIRGRSTPVLSPASVEPTDVEPADVVDDD